MGQFKDARPSLTLYRDNDDLASTSSAVPLLEQVLETEEAPPAYSDDPLEYGSRDRVNRLPAERMGSLSPDYGQVDVKTNRDSKGTTVTYISGILTSDPKACLSFVKDQTHTLPVPLVRMIGMHTETRQRDKKEEKVQVMDFDISISLQRFLVYEWRRSTVVDNAQKAYRGGVFRSMDPRIKAHPEAAHTTPQLEEWCHRFCASGAPAKSFRVSRKVTGLDYSQLTNDFTSILRSTNYRGRIQIAYQLQSRASIIVSDHWINRYRHNAYVWWICVLLQLWIFTWPILWILTKRWEILEVQWPTQVQKQPDGSWPVTDESQPHVMNDGYPTSNPDVRNAGINETDWARQWTLAVQLAAEGRRTCTLTDTDRTTAAAIVERLRQRATQDAFGTNPRNDFVGAAAGLLREVGGIMREQHTLSGWGGDC